MGDQSYLDPIALQAMPSDPCCFAPNVVAEDPGRDKNIFDRIELQD
jgi:hypothetical protein